MIVILNRDVKGTGKAGDVVKVSDGYARNMLLPKGYAMEATEGNVRSLEKQKAISEQKKADEKAAATELAKKLEDIKVVIQTKSGDNGRLFGSITSKDIAEQLEQQYGLNIDKKKIQLNSPIRQLGQFDVKVKLYQDITAEMTVVVSE